MIESSQRMIIMVNSQLEEGINPAIKRYFELQIMTLQEAINITCHFSATSRVNNQVMVNNRVKCLSLWIIESRICICR
jgi:hypothetical protein